MVDLPGGEGANEGFWRFQIRDKYGRWVQMGGAVTFSTNHPNFGRITGTGLFEGGSRPGFAMIRVKNSAGLEDGVYEVAATDMEAVKAIIPENAPGLIEAKKLDAADGISANPLAPMTLESLPEATPSAAGQNAYYVEFEGTELNSEEAKRGVHMYVGQGYKLINKILRDNPEGSVEEFIATSNSESYLAEATGVGFDGEFAATAGSKIADLDFAISSTNLKNDTTLYRGMTAKPDRYQDLLDMEPGDEFQDFGFVSTSTLEKSAMSFTSTSVQGKEQGRKPILFRIEAGAGSNAMRTFSGINGESEVVLPRGTKVEIVSKSQRDGVLIIDAKLVSTNPAPTAPEVVEAPAVDVPKKELTAQERETLLWFTDDGYAKAADKLRKNRDISESDQERVDTILALIDSSETTEDRVVYRGKASRSSGRATQINNLQIGDVMLDPGIGSTSPEERIGKRFAEFFQDIPDIKIRYVLAINVPKGSRAYDIPEDAHSYGRSEKEVLLPPNTALSVTGLEDRDGVRYITADVVDSAEYLDKPGETIPEDKVGVIDVVNESAEDRGAVDTPEPGNWTSIDEANGISGRGDDSVFDKALKGNKFDLKALGGTYQSAEDLEMFNDTDKQAVRAYTSSNAFKVWNRVLRSGDAAELTKNKEGIDQLDAAIADHGEVFGKDTTVYRGFRIQPGKADWKGMVENLNVDDVMTDDAYMSTSNSPDVAYGGFGAAAGWGVTDGDYNSDFEGADGSIFWSIKLPEGSTAMAIPPELGYHGDSEDEVLLPRGSQVRVKSIRKVQQRTISGEPKPGIYNYFLETEYIGAKPIQIEAPKPGEEPIRVEG